MAKNYLSLHESLSKSSPLAYGKRSFCCELIVDWAYST